MFDETKFCNLRAEAFDAISKTLASTDRSLTLIAVKIAKALSEVSVHHQRPSCPVLSIVMGSPRPIEGEIEAIDEYNARRLYFPIETCLVFDNEGHIVVDDTANLIAFDFTEEFYTYWQMTSCLADVQRFFNKLASPK